MKKLIATAILLVIMPALMWAQGADHPPRGLGYVFVGGATHQMGITTGFGGEGYAYRGLGVGAEVGAAGVHASSNGEPNIIGVGSADLSYHFFPKKIRGNAAPFVAGGYTLFFGQDTHVGTGSVAHGFNVGGGVDIFATKHLGVRFDVRYYAHGDHILWPSFPNVTQLSFTAFRVGVTFR